MKKKLLAAICLSFTFSLLARSGSEQPDWVELTICSVMLLQKL